MTTSLLVHFSDSAVSCHVKHPPFITNTFHIPLHVHFPLPRPATSVFTLTDNSARVMVNLAGLYKGQGQDRYEEAESLFAEAIEIMRLSLPKDHADIARSLRSLAAMYTLQKRYTCLNNIGLL